MIPSVSGERRGTELVAESGHQGLELWHKRSFVVGTGVVKFKRKANPLLNTTLHVSIEPKKVLAHSTMTPSLIKRTKRVALFGNAVSSGRYVSAKVKYRVERPISNK